MDPRDCTRKGLLHVLNAFNLIMKGRRFSQSAVALPEMGTARKPKKLWSVKHGVDW